MKAGTTLYCHDRSEWRAWLSEHFETEPEIWLIFPAKRLGEQSVTYNEAVEEALCFGWIDGQAGTLDEGHQLRRFTPRRKGSPYSRLNIERLTRQYSLGKVHPKMQEAVEAVIRVPYVFPEDILAAIQADAEAWEHYQAFPEPYRRIRVAYIDDARKRPAEFAKRLAHFLKKTRENKRIGGYDGTEQYYE